MQILATAHIIYDNLQGICSLWKLDFEHQTLIVKVVTRRIHVLVLTKVDVSYNMLVWALKCEGRRLTVLSDEVIIRERN